MDKLNMSAISLSVIVTAYNEEQTIRSVVNDAAKIIDELKIDYEIIIVDDSSVDETGTIIDQLATEHPATKAIHNKDNLGWGASYLVGVNAARYKYIMLLCGDGGLPPANLPKMLKNIGSADIIVPYMQNLRQIKTPFRYFISRSYTIFLNFISGLDLEYYNGLSIHRRDLVSGLSVKSTGFGFQAEILIRLITSGCSFVEIGVSGASKNDQKSVLIKPANILNVLRTCLLLSHACLKLRMFRLSSIVRK